MAIRSVPEWYQTCELITASVKIKGMDGDVFAVHFTDKYCVIDKNSKLNLLLIKNARLCNKLLACRVIVVP